MHGLLLRSLGVLVLIALLLAALAGQTGSRNPANKPVSSNTWTPPLAPDGHPDLQGVWLVNTATPLERPKELEGREQLTDEEVAELKRRADRIFKNGDSDFAAGDNLFLAALRNVEHYGTGTTATENSVGMIEREFDNRTSLVIDPIDGRIPPLTDEARRRQAAARGTGQHPAGPEDFSNAYRCITTGVPKLGGLYGAGHFSYYEIIQTRQYIVLETETIHDARIIPLDGRPHLPESVRQWNGDSRARWEGKALVVDTTNFSPKSSFMGSTDHLHLVERFTRVAANTITYEITIDDTTTWTKPWTAVLPLKQTSEQMYEFACHEGNQIIMRGMLAAARADESAETREKLGTKPR
jgi:hypothetical protein